MTTEKRERGKKNRWFLENHPVEKERDGIRSPPSLSV
jgi:hypothetical protein